MKRRKFEVCGGDDEGDLHTFATDDRDRAEEVAAIMREDLANVELMPGRTRPSRLPKPAELLMWAR